MRRLLSYMFVLLAVWVTSSCSFIMDNGQCEDVSKGGRAIFFSMDLGEGMVRTKADQTWGDPYTDEIGIGFDNSIRPDDFHVVIYGSDNSCIGAVDKLSWAPVNGSETTYEFKGEITDMPLNTTDTYKVVIYANTGAPDGTAALGANDGPREMWFDMASVNPENSDSRMPMWGIISSRFTLAERQELGDISMLRSAAKIRIRMSESVIEEGYRITGAGLNKYNELGYCLPSSWNTSENTLKLYQEGCFRPYSSITTSTLDFIIEEDGSEAVIYMPEMEGDGISDPITLTVKDSNGAEKDYSLQFRNYSGGSAGADAFDIVRNHIYDYNIGQIKAGGTELILTCQVQPWEYADEEVEFSNNVTIESGNEIEWTEGYSSLDAATHKVVLRNNGTCAVCNFKISTPVGAEWFASIVTESGVFGAFEFDGDSSGLVGEEAELRIRVTDTTPQVVSTAKLRITVRTADGTTIVVKTLVNAAGDEFTLIQNI